MYRSCRGHSIIMCMPKGGVRTRNCVNLPLSFAVNVKLVLKKKKKSLKTQWCVFSPVTEILTWVKICVHSIQRNFLLEEIKHFIIEILLEMYPDIFTFIFHKLIIPRGLLAKVYVIRGHLFWPLDPGVERTHTNLWLWHWFWQWARVWSTCIVFLPSSHFIPDGPSKIFFKNSTLFS